MRQVKLREKVGNELVFLDNLDMSCPIFAKKGGDLVGMIISENAGWILRFGTGTGATGHHNSREECVESCIKHNYSFFVDI